jgi:hypothetical protein
VGECPISWHDSPQGLRIRKRCPPTATMHGSHDAASGPSCLRPLDAEVKAGAREDRRVKGTWRAGTWSPSMAIVEAQNT